MVTPAAPEPVRLARRVTELAGCSRSEAEQYIEDGWVSVDGTIIEEPQYKVLDEKVVIDPSARLTPTEPATILLHKPAGYDAGDDGTGAVALIKAAARWADDRTGIRTLKRHGARLSAVLPLEPEASGLVVLTQDSRVLRRMSEEATQIEQEYVVEITGQPAADALRRLSHGFNYKGRVLPRAKVSWANENRLRFAVKDVQPGQLAHVCSQVGLVAVAIKRLRIGKISLLKMPPEAWRYLPVQERF
jgi:23S rRNA pseudouridine2604 synthase